MFDNFVKQVSKLFSSKSNGGKLVYNLVDKLHGYKQILLATSIILLLGYSQFRVHFLCQSSDRLDKATLTNFCWINGTTTVNKVNGIGPPQPQQHSFKLQSPANSSSRVVDLPEGSHVLDQIVPHVGIHFRLNDGGNYEIVNHNYMRSLWTLLILMAVCSYVAQRKWSNIFADDLLKALLKLPGNEQLPIVAKAQAANLYGELSKLIADNDRHKLKDVFGGGGSGSSSDSCQAAAAINSAGEMQMAAFEVLADGNEHNHDLDYYPNQLIYLLGTRRQFAYKLPQLELRKRILLHSYWSLLLTVAQFVLPWCFIGPKYTWYGWQFASAVLRNLLDQLLGPPSPTTTSGSHTGGVNSFDYELSSAIFPTSVSCEHKQFSFHGIERVPVQCTVPINEICGKLFAIIWWFVVVNIAIELWWCLKQTICSLTFPTIQRSFGTLYWPRARLEAKLVNNFRYRYANLWERVEADAAEFELEAKAAVAAVVESGQQQNNNATTNGLNKRQQQLSERERKHLEAETDRLNRLDSKRGLCSMFSHDISLNFLNNNSGKQSQKGFPDMAAAFGGSTRQSADHEAQMAMRQSRRDTNLYYLLYLLYLRLGCSRSQVEQVIQMTSEALTCYLDRLEHSSSSSSEHHWSSLGAGHQSVSGPMSSSTTSTTIVPMYHSTPSSTSTPTSTSTSTTSSNSSTQTTLASSMIH